jgi:acyl-coenzyme A synthetase/AMP-(fatty) acid ligase
MFGTPSSTARPLLPDRPSVIKDDVMYAIATSGSTGTPKLVPEVLFENGKLAAVRDSCRPV